jgi:hypothetical protein
MKRINLIALFLLLAFSNSIYAQAEKVNTKTKCLEGDCINGKGKLQVKFPTQHKNDRLSHRVFSGNFTNGKLEGEVVIEYFGKDKSSFTLKAIFEEGELSLYDSISFVTSKYVGKGMLEAKNKDVFNTPGELLGLKGTFESISKSEFNKFTRGGVNLKSFTGTFSLYSIAGDNLFYNNVIPYEYTMTNGITIQIDATYGSTKDDLITFPKKGENFPCNGYVHSSKYSLRRGLELQQSNQFVVKTIEILANGAIRTGEYSIFSWDCCKKNGVFILKNADGTQVSETYKDNVLVSSTKIDK